jgi:hypothetical protein
MGTLLLPDEYEKQTSLDPVELVDEFFQIVRNGGADRQVVDPGTRAVFILVVVPGDGGREST